MATAVETDRILDHSGHTVGTDEADPVVEHDPTVRSCGFCYVNLPTDSISYSIPCPSCPRLYCSSNCRKSDEATHSFWCGKVGEKDVDFHVRPIAGKGLGLVAKRDFERGEKILAERPIATTTNVERISSPDEEGKDEEYKRTQEEVEKTNDNIFKAVMTLTPLDGDLYDKFNSNGVSIKSQDAETNGDMSPQIAAGLFLTFSRTNHDCLGNSDHYFDSQNGVELLVANDTIPAGTEITFPYSRTGKKRRADLRWRGFECTCQACKSPSLDAKVNQMSSLDEEVIYLGAQSEDWKRAQAVHLAHTLLKIFDEVGASCRDYARIHYDLFQILVVEKDTLEEASHHMVHAYEYALRFCGYEGHETIQLYKGYVDHPESHVNYRAID